MGKAPKYRRVLLKLSGEALGNPGAGFDLQKVKPICRQIKSLTKAGVQIAIVVGGGNLVRGRDLAAKWLSSESADTMGMLATVINGIALQEALEHSGIPARLQTAIPMQSVAEPFARRRCIRYMNDGKVVVLAAGTGHPHFTTDTAAALRAREIGADVLLKATKVDGVYCSDPKKNPRARHLAHLTYADVLKDNLEVMDATAVTMCREGRIPIIVFNLTKPGSIRKAVFGYRVGTTIGEK